MNNKELDNINEEKFCLMFVGAPAPYGGNAERCYEAVFGAKDGQTAIDIALDAKQLMREDRIKMRIHELEEQFVVNATTLRPRLTNTLLKIAEECSVSEYTDRFGVPLSPAALRSVAVNAIKTLSDIYGIKEDVAHRVSIEGGDGNGVVINVIAPQKADDTPNFDAIEQ